MICIGRHDGVSGLRSKALTRNIKDEDSIFEMILVWYLSHNLRIQFPMKPSPSRILFLHSAGHQHGDEGSARLVAYLKATLPDMELIAPIMPHPDNPDYEVWKAALSQIFTILDHNVILIGHSIGGSVLLKYLSEEKQSHTIAALHLIAVPFWGAEDWEVEEFELKPGFTSNLPPIGSVTIYHSQDDKVVPVSHAQLYADALQAEVIILDGYGHAFADGLQELAARLISHKATF
jgi:predicted alpha/beta hydrolase family esterase